MTISTRGRYALRVMIELCEHPAGQYVPLRTIAQRQGISLKYLESIMVVLSKAGYVDAMHGKGGGYRLSRAPEAYTAADILTLTEGSLAPVACVSDCGAGCERSPECRTLPMWTGLDQAIDGYLRGYTLERLAKST